MARSSIGWKRSATRNTGAEFSPRSDCIQLKMAAVRLVRRPPSVARSAAAGGDGAGGDNESSPAAIQRPVQSTLPNTAYSRWCRAGLFSKRPNAERRVVHSARNVGPHSALKIGSTKEDPMSRHILVAAAAALSLWSGAAAAQSPAEQGFRQGGRAAGAPGAIVGGAVGEAVELPGDILGFVTGHPRHYDRVREDIVVGQPLPRRVHVYEIPRHRDYEYAYVNDRRVIVEPRTRKVVRVVE